MLVNAPAELRTFDSNRAVLLLACGRNHDCQQVLLGLAESDVDARIESFIALALARTGNRRGALALLTETETRYGTSAFLSAIHANIDAHRGFFVSPGLTVDVDPIPGIRHSLEALRGLDHSKQAQAVDPHGRLDLYLINEIRGACASVVALAPAMRGLEIDGREDDISIVLKQLLLSRLLPVQWAVEDQSRGGFSAAGNPGERDLAVTKGPVVLAVIEAVITRYVEAANLTSHFEKLLGYATCLHFFHVTYARLSNCSRILGFLKEACRNPTAGIIYQSEEDLEDSSSLPIGFKALYIIGDRPVIVTFLVLEIGQGLQRTAAATAGA